MKFNSVLLILLLPLVCLSQRISYSEPEREDSRTLDFEIIGKVSGNFLVYKNLRSHYTVSIYDNDMGLKERADLDFMPDKTLNTDFISYSDFAYIIYQYQKRNVLHCMAVKIDGNGKKIGEAVELDTTQINIFSDNKIYNMVNSEDKQNIMIYKIQKKNEKLNFKTLLFNSQLQPQHTSRIQMSFDERKDVFSDFYLDNEGTFIFTKSLKGGNRELISKLSLLTKSPVSDQFIENELPLKSYLDEVSVKVDNVNKRYLLNSFYYNQKRGNIDGLYTAIWDKPGHRLLVQNMAGFNDTMKREAKNEGAARFAYNDFFIRNIILKKDGGFILAAEDFSSQSRSNPWNRLDYLYGYPYGSTYDYYMYPRSSYWYYYRPRSTNSLNRYYYNNIAVMNIDKDGKLVWSNVIRKEQYDDGDDNFLSYLIMNAGGELHFLFNELERRNQLLSDQSIAPDGRLTRNPTLKSLDRGYQFMPRFAKQVSAKQIIVPCVYRNYICFAKIDF
ncbi:MAG TPA: hypothetical protein VMY77_11095 [Chitinophagaceae bacterium]|nr:hypothetical protein [Chitinophagaceae bacterium]